MIGVLGGVAFVIASACIVNNMIDRRRDGKMRRTKGRELVVGHISIFRASLFALFLGIIGFTFLAIGTNVLTLTLGVVAYLWYIVIYGIAKRTTPLSTIIGGVCGALPPVAGYTAVTNQLDGTAWTLFALLMIWQLAHFYAIALFRKSDYEQAGIPVWSVRYGTASTKAQLLFWVAVFAFITPLLTVFGATGLIYAVVMLGLSAYWVYVGVRYYRKLDDERWARKMFGVSLIVLLALCLFIALGGYLP
jgi:heme o synthase